MGEILIPASNLEADNKSEQKLTALSRGRILHIIKAVSPIWAPLVAYHISKEISSSDDVQAVATLVGLMVSGILTYQVLGNRKT